MFFNFIVVKADENLAITISVEGDTVEEAEEGAAILYPDHVICYDDISEFQLIES